MSLSHEVVDGADALEALSTEWTALLGRSAGNEPTLSPKWLLTWWRTFGPVGGRRLSTLLIREDGRLVGMVPLLRRLALHRGLVPFRRLELLGSGEPEQHEIASDYIGVIAERGREEAVARRLVSVLEGRDMGTWDDVVLPEMNGEGELPALLETAFREAGFDARMTVVNEAYYVPLAQTWEEFLGSLGTRRRGCLRRQLREFEGWAESWEIRSARTPEELAEGKKVLTDLHGSRWRAAGHGGSFSSPLFQAFHDELMPRLLAADALDLSWMTVAGRPVAALYNVIWNGKVYAYQSGRITDVPNGVSPGIAMNAYSMKRAIERGLREYDFLGGPTTHKRDFTPHKRPLVSLRVSRAPFRERARQLTESAVGLAKRVRARLTGRRGRPSPAPRPH